MGRIFTNLLVRVFSTNYQEIEKGFSAYKTVLRRACERNTVNQTTYSEIIIPCKIFNLDLALAADFPLHVNIYQVLKLFSYQNSLLIAG